MLTYFDMRPAAPPASIRPTNTSDKLDPTAIHILPMQKSQVAWMMVYLRPQRSSTIIGSAFIYHDDDDFFTTKVTR